MNPTEGVRQLVADVLHTLSQPYTVDVTEHVCLAIAGTPAFRQRYNELAAGLRDWVVNNWIGQYTAELTGRRSGAQVQSNSGLIQSYKKLHSS